MKNKKKTKKIKKESEFPQQLKREDLFSSPIWFEKEAKFVDDLNKFSDKYIEEAKKLLKPDIDKRNKKFGDKGDMVMYFIQHH